MTPPNYPHANAAFALGLFQEAYRASTGKPVQVSPFSVRRALSMTAVGATGKTLDAFRDAFMLPRGTDMAAVHQDNQNVLARLIAAESGARNPTEIMVANALWLKLAEAGRYQFRAPFVDANKRWYGAAVNAGLPFDDSTLAAINQWCSDSTKGKIEKILNNLPDDAHAVLTDALYLKTPAKNRFYKRYDTTGKFKKSDGTEVDVTFMTNPWASLNYFKGDGVQVLQFPFGERGAYNYYLVLPDADRTLGDAVKKLTVQNWLGWKAALSNATGKFRLAPNEQEYDGEMKPLLSAMGLGVAFTDDADFDAMCTDPLKIGAVKHKTYTKFTRKGFEGAAVTAVVMVEKACAPRPSTNFDITVDRPYAWFVEGKGEILFASTTLDPKQPKSFADESDDDDNM